MPLNTNRPKCQRVGCGWFNVRALCNKCPDVVSNQQILQRKWDQAKEVAMKEGFCYCKIGAGGKPCVSRETCDKRGGTNQYVKQESAHEDKS